MIVFLADGQLPSTNFQTIDWVIVGVYLAASVAIGVLANRYISRLSDFLVAGRSLRVYLGIATMTGTEIGLVTLMYQANDGYVKGLSTLHVGVVWGLAALLIGLGGWVISGLREAGVMTIPEYYGQRYGKGVRVLGGVILASAGILNMGLFLRAGADFVMAVTGLESAEWLKVVMTALMVLVLIYTVLGGMVSVVVTDLIQFIVLGIGMVAVTIFVVSAVGWSDIFEAAATKGPAGLDPFHSGEDGSGFGPVYVVSMVLLALSAAALWQSGTLRALSARDVKTAKRIYAWSSITFFARFAIPAFWGVAAFAFLAENPDLARHVSDLAGGEPGKYKPIQAMPLMIGTVVPSVMLGIVVAAMMAAFMSTHDSYMLCWASVLTQDVVAPLRREMSDAARIRMTRIFIVAQGVMFLLMGLWFPAPESLWSYMATTGTIYLSGASAVVVLGLYWRRASPAGAVAALSTGCLAALSVAKDFAWAKESIARVSGDPDAAGVLDHVVAFVANDDTVRVLAFACAWIAMIVVSLLVPGSARTSEEAS